MAAERTSGIDFTGLEETFEWLKAKKNFLVGIALILALGWAASSFVSNQLEEQKREPWQAVFGADATPWEATPAELEALLSAGTVKGTAAEPYVRYWLALSKHEAGDAAGALAALQAFKRDYAGSALSSAKLPGSDHELRSAVERMEAQITALEQWKQQNPLPAANPPPNGAAVTLVTDRGNIVIGLYPEQAPQSCAAFLEVAPLLKDRFIGKVAPEKWIEAGLTEAGVAFDTDAVKEPFPPFEVNALSHFAGAVTFRQAPFTKGPFQPDLRVLLATDFNEAGRSTVFGHVVAGFDLLLAMTKDPRKAENPQLLETPIKITEVQIAPAGSTPPGGGSGN
ncbi:MAG: peptidylprolyl isomerase [Planctomycetes bacterium]|nr:peptidylprolyl isomerase [Planctomycetota bacterium]